MDSHLLSSQMNDNLRTFKINSAPMINEFDDNYNS